MNTNQFFANGGDKVSVSLNASNQPTVGTLTSLDLIGIGVTTAGGHKFFMPWTAIANVELIGGVL